MGAHPKNKITRVEQGKRRAGNRPKLAKNAKHVAVPAHKKSLFSRFAAAVKGAVTKPATKKAKKAVKSTKIAATPKPVEAKPVEAAAKPAPKKTATKTTKTVKKAAAKKSE